MNKYDYDIIVIGAGSGGLTSAVGAAGIGAKVLLVEKEKIGGDCTHYGCVPSKTLIATARLAKKWSQRKQYGLIQTHDEKSDIMSVLKKVGETVETVENRFESEELLRQKGVDIARGRATFLDKHTIKCGDTQYTAKKFIIATGAFARVPSITGLDEAGYATNKTIFTPRALKSIVVLGGGAIGCELSQAFKNLGVEVTLVHKGKRLLEKEDEEASALICKQLKDDGVNVLLESEIVKTEKVGQSKKIWIETNKEKKEVATDELLIAIGRTPNTKGIGLEKISVAYDKFGIVVNDHMQTSAKNIFAVGDVVAGPQFTHMADSEAKVALARAIFHAPAGREKRVVPRVTFTTPEIASVGEVVAEKKEETITLKKEYSHNDRAITEHEENGFIKIITNKRGMILGVTIVGAQAGELIGLVAMAMKNNLPITALSKTIMPYPTHMYALRTCADLFRKASYTDTKKKMVKWLFGLRGNKK